MCRNRLPKGIVDVPSLEALKAQLVLVSDLVVGIPSRAQGYGCFQPETFCNSMKIE